MAQQEWFVYAHILKADGRRYIGQTNNLNARWKPSAYKNCVKFYNAIILYGWDAFEHTVLKENLTLEQANEREEYYIALYDTIENGFNLLSGGMNRLASQETKNKMSQTRKGVPKSDAHKEAIAQALKGKKKTPEAIRNNQLAQHRKIVKCIETNITYESLADAERKTGILSETISRCCRGKQKTASGFHWEFVQEGDYK